MDISTLRELAALPVAAFAIYCIYLLTRQIVSSFKDLVGNHLEHNTQAIEKLAEVLHELHVWLKEKFGSR